MRTVNECVDGAISACQKGHEFQKGIRELMEEPTTDEWTLVEVVSNFRNDIERWAVTAERKKKVNNIVNDISRICRGTYGKSIVCKKKKPAYRYEAVEPRAKKAVSYTHLTLPTILLV